ncbi:hypothetical protein BDP67DRAFT_533170 [Colletotrichum lupini]|nr:hypothetical protein BDP67DRAFT_533170 [Colletotrichum lupini]
MGGLANSPILLVLVGPLTGPIIPGIIIPPSGSGRFAVHSLLGRPGNPWFQNFPRRWLGGGGEREEGIGDPGHFWILSGPGFFGQYGYSNGDGEEGGKKGNAATAKHGQALRRSPFAMWLEGEVAYSVVTMVRWRVFGDGVVAVESVGKLGADGI